MILEKRQALDNLIKLGILIPFENLELYHGRAKTDDTPWEVLPNFPKEKNSKRISTLSVSYKDVADKFAQYHAIEKNTTPETYRIVSQDPFACFYNRDFNVHNLSDEDKHILHESLKILVGDSITATLPIIFEYRETYEDIINKMSEKTSLPWYTFLCTDDIQECADQLQEGRVYAMFEPTYQIATAYNSLITIPHDLPFMMRRFVNQESIIDFNGREFPISLDFMQNWLRECHIIGEKKTSQHICLDDSYDSYTIFDRDNVNTQEIIQNKKRDVEGTYKSLIELINTLCNGNLLEYNLTEHSPQEIVNYIRQYPKFSELLDMSAGVWEGFTIAQHTESAIRVFDQSYEYDVPNNIKPFIKLCLLTHDIGKGIAVEIGNKKKQDKYNSFYTTKLLQQLNINPDLIQLIKYLVVDAQHYTSEYFVNKNKASQIALMLDLKKELKKLNITPTDELLRGLLEISKIIQTCDSGAYTRYGITRAESNFYYYNGSDKFTKSIQKPVGFNLNKQRLNEPTMNEFGE